MALEDHRSSPNTANSPGPISNEKPTTTECTRVSSASPVSTTSSSMDNLNNTTGTNCTECLSNNENEIDEKPIMLPLRFSIDSILQPEFGRKALVTKLNTLKPKVLYRPYDLSTTNSKPDEKPVKPFKCTTSASLTSLGNLCETVSQNNTISAVPKRITNSVSQNFSTPNHEQTEKYYRDTVSPAKSTISTASNDSIGSTSTTSSSNTQTSLDPKTPTLWPAWIYCTRYSDRPSSGPRSRRMKKPNSGIHDEKRPRTAFSGAQLQRLKNEFAENRYLTERRRQQLSAELGLNEAQIKIWFQNKRAKIKKSSGQKNPLALQLMAQAMKIAGQSLTTQMVQLRLRSPLQCSYTLN